MKNDILIKTKNSQKDLKNLFIYSYFHSSIGILFTIIGILGLFSVLVYFSGMFPKIKFPFAELTMSIFLLIILPIINIIKANKVFKNGIFGETLNYRINKDNITIIGESFNSTFRWQNIFKVIETKNWFLFYLTKNNVYLINKSILSENIKNDLKGLIRSIPSLKYRLKS